MDEPATGLDPLMQSVFFELLRSENQKGLTIFFSSHNLGEVQMFCRRVGIIKEGKIINVEDIESLRKRQLKKVFIETIDPANIETFDIEGAENIYMVPGNSLSFLYSGNLNNLITKFSGTKLSNLIIEEPSLEEIFMHYYRV